LTPIRPKLLLSTAETLLPATRNDLEKTFGAPLRDEYGLAEVGGFVARECPQGAGGYHLLDDYLLEVVDHDGRSVDFGVEGEILITNLYHTAVPILRYRTGDYGVLSDEPCPCGWSGPRLARFAGRELCRFVLSSGERYNPFDVYREFLLELPVRQFQMVQDTDGAITFRWAGDPAVADLEAVRALRGRVLELHGSRHPMRLERVESFQHHNHKFHVFLRLEPQPAEARLETVGEAVPSTT
jgi:phenylacetate-CoA ligase